MVSVRLDAAVTDHDDDEFSMLEKNGYRFIFK